MSRLTIHIPWWMLYTLALIGVVIVSEVMSAGPLRAGVFSLFVWLAYFSGKLSVGSPEQEGP